MKFIRFIIFTGLISSFLSFFVLFNLKVCFGSPEKAKRVLNNSDAYNIVAGAIRENIVNVNPSLGNTNLLEQLSDKVGDRGFQTIAEDLIDQIYSIDKKNTQITLRYSLLQNELPGVTLPADQSYDLSQYPGFTLIYGSFYTFLAGSALTLIITLLLHLSLIGTDKRSRMSWLGANLLIVSICLVSLIVSYYYMLPGQMDRLMEAAAIENQKIARGLIKTLTAVLLQQRSLYIIEFLVTLISSLVLIIISRAYGKQNYEIDERMAALSNIK